jgi:hypothetical protein
MKVMQVVQIVHQESTVLEETQAVAYVQQVMIVQIQLLF